MIYTIITITSITFTITLTGICYRCYQNRIQQEYLDLNEHYIIEEPSEENVVL